MPFRYRTRPGSDQPSGRARRSRLTEGMRRLRCLRCDLMEELHVCQRRVDQLDWLIRETERANTEKTARRI